MKRSHYVFLIFLIFFFLLTATILAFIYYEFRKPTAIQTHSYLEIDLAGPLPEFSEPDFLTALFLGPRPLSMHDLWQNLRKAKVDNRIRAVLLRFGYLGCDWAKASEVREAILDFRQSGKKAYAFIEEAPDADKEYFIATACDKVILHPLGWLGINGIGGWVPFVRGGLEKLGIEFEVEHVEEFKTAYNIFTETGFTPAHRTMMESLYSDIFNHYVQTIGQARGKSEAEMKQLIDRGLFQGEAALRAGLVDALLYQDDLEKLLLEEDKKTELKRVRMSDYTRVSPSSLGLDRGRKIALIYASGPIHTGEGIYQTIGSRSLSRYLRQAREAKNIEAIVLRVDSPGGSAVASDVIWREMVLAKKEKPVVVSMSDVAGSGGYWISMGAHKIVAQPGTLTGSIGVISGKVNMAGFYRKMGITAERLTYGQKADLFTSWRGLTQEERDFLKKEILWVYDQFLSKVAEGRNLAKAEVDRIGRGRVWTGHQARKINLVDDIGGLAKAIELAKSLAGIPLQEEVRLVVMPKRISLLAALFGRREARLKLPLLDAELVNLLSALDILREDKPWAIMPFWRVAGQ